MESSPWHSKGYAQMTKRRCQRMSNYEVLMLFSVKDGAKPAHVTVSYTGKPVLNV